MKKWLALGVVLATLFIVAMRYQPASDAISCTVEFSSSQWALFYERAQGSGLIECDNGQHMYVDLYATGVGLSAGKWKIEGTQGKISGLNDINQVLGTYTALSAHAGVAQSGSVQAMSKEPVLLLLAGRGHGFDAGITLSRLKIERSAIDDSV